MLDAGAGEGDHKHYFAAQRYCGLDLGIGDHAWDYSRLDVLGDLETLPFPDATFEAAINIVTLEHVLHPERVLCELGRVLAPGGRFLLVAPLAMGGAPAAPRLRPVHALCARSPAAAGRIYGDFDPAGGRHFPADLAAAAERVAILSRAADAGGGGVFRASGAGAAAARPPGQRQVFYTGIYMFRAQAFLIAVLSTAAFGSRRSPALPRSSSLAMPSPSDRGRRARRRITSCRLISSRSSRRASARSPKMRSRRRLPRVPSR